MESDRADRRRDSDSRSSGNRRTYTLAVLFGAPVALLVFAASLTVIPLIYLAICAEGVAVALLATSDVQSAEAHPIGPDEEGSAAVPSYSGIDRVEVLAENVKSAAKGSDLSRREISRMVTRILDQSKPSPGATSSVSSEETGTDGNLSQAMADVVQPSSDRYKSTSEGSRQTKPVPGSGYEQRPPGRGRYLQSLEQVVSYLERGMSR
jgi:hypothetical protein